jgi:hypothetical protein
LIGDLKRGLEAAISTGELEARREDAYYVVYLARAGLVPNAPPDLVAEIIATGGGAEEGLEGPHKGVDREDPEPGVLACGHDPDNDPCVP